MTRTTETERLSEPLFAVAIVLSGTDDASDVRALLSRLAADAVSVLIWRLDDEPLSDAAQDDPLLSQSRFFIHTLADGDSLEPGGLYLVPPQCSVWFEAQRVRVASGCERSLHPVDRFLASFAESWGRRGVAVMPRALGGDGERGLGAVQAARGVALGPPAFESLAQEEPRLDAPGLAVVPGLAAARLRGYRSRVASIAASRPKFRVQRLFSLSPALLGVARAAAEAAVRNAAPRGRVRVWVPGCRTGTLAYTMAMLLLEASAASPVPVQVQVFGTDHDEEALAVARSGRFPAQAAVGMDPTLRARYAHDERETIRVSEVLREVCIFSRHKLIKNPPLSRMDLVVCQRVFEGTSLARREEVIDALYFALRDGGVLLPLDHKGAFPSDRFEPMPEGYLAVRALRAKTLSSAPRPTRPPSRNGVSLFGDAWQLHDGPEEQKLEAHARVGAELERLVHAIGVPLILCDGELRVSYVSQEAERALGLSERDRGERLEALLARLPGRLELLQAVQRAVASAHTQELTLRTDRSVYLVRVSAAEHAAGSGVAIVLSDVSALEAAKAQAVMQRHQQTAVARLGNLALRQAPQAQLFDEALAALFGNIPVCSSGLILERPHAGAELEVVASRGLGPDPLAALAELGAPAELVRTVVEREVPIVQASVDADKAPEGLAGLACPIFNEGRVLGAIALYARKPSIGALDHQHFVQAVANVLGGAIARHRTRRRLSLELEVSTLSASAPDLEAMGNGLQSALAAATAASEIELWLLASDGSGWARAYPHAGDAAQAERWAGEPLGDEPVYRAEGTGRAPELLVPVASRQATLGVLRLRGAGLHAPDDQLAQGLQRVGRMLGDFLERLHILEALRQSEASYRKSCAELGALYESLPVAVSIHDRHGAVHRVNAHLATLRAAEPRDGAFAHFHEHEAPPWVQRVLETGEAIRDLELSVEAAGESRTWLCNFAPIRDVDGSVLGASSVVQDITKLKRVEASLREADKQKDDFLAMLGHELRNPMAAMRNATELLRRIEPTTPQVLRVHSVFERQTQQVTRLIDGLLDVARVARGKVELQLSPVPVCELVRQVVDDRRHQLAERQIELSLPDSELWTVADRVRLVQVLDNLLTNAQKFSLPNGHIRVEVVQRGEVGALSVSDDGLGIEADVLPRVFEPFRQGRATLAHAQGGLGLGLALVKGLVELHGFRLEASSEGPGRGASFLIEFPTIAPPVDEAPESRFDTRALELLLVEDNSDIADTLAELLMAAGHRVEIVSSGEQALRELHKHRPDVVLCDIGLPGMDGLALASLVRSDPALRELKLVALTGYGDQPTRARIEDAGFDRLLVKPVQLEALQGCLARLAVTGPRELASS